MSELCVRCHVSGRVQGVCYRAATQAQAQALGLGGFARNLADGRVEVLVRGSAAAVEELVAWLAEGPPLAQVSRVERVTLDCSSAPAPADFQVR